MQVLTAAVGVSLRGEIRAATFFDITTKVRALSIIRSDRMTSSIPRLLHTLSGLRKIALFDARPHKQSSRDHLSALLAIFVASTSVSSVRAAYCQRVANCDVARSLVGDLNLNHIYLWKVIISSDHLDRRMPRTIPV